MAAVVSESLFKRGCGTWGTCTEGSGPRVVPLMMRSKASWVMVPWKPPCRQTDRHVKKHFVAGSKKANLFT